MKSKLLVEGKYDDRVIRKICERISLPFEEHFEIQGKGGIQPLLDSLEVELDGRSDVVAIICDADEDCGLRWDEIQIACRKAGLEFGDEAPATGGFIWNRAGQEKFGCWIMPDNRQSGALEGQLFEGIEQLLREQARAFIERVEPRQFPDTEAALQKATLRAWFAVQEEPIWLPSFAVEHLFLLPKLEENDAFVAWLRKLDAVAGLTAV